MCLPLPPVKLEALIRDRSGKNESSTCRGNTSHLGMRSLVLLCTVYKEVNITSTQIQRGLGVTGCTGGLVYRKLLYAVVSQPAAELKAQHKQMRGETAFLLSAISCFGGLQRTCIFNLTGGPSNSSLQYLQFIFTLDELLMMPWCLLTIILLHWQWTESMLYIHYCSKACGQ